MQRWWIWEEKAGSGVEAFVPCLPFQRSGRRGDGVVWCPWPCLPRMNPSFLVMVNLKSLLLLSIPLPLTELPNHQLLLRFPRQSAIPVGTC